MPDVRDAIPRSTMAGPQQRRIGALQSAKVILYGQPGYQTERPRVDVDDMLRLARWIETGERDG